MNDEPIELEAAALETREADKRPRIEVPPAVRLLAVEDCVLAVAAGLEVELDHFYVSVLGFEREVEADEIVYRAENFRLRINVMERLPVREDYRPLGVALPSLRSVMQRLDEEEIEFIRERGLSPGVDKLVVNDPGGNPVEITEFRIVI